MKKNAGIGFCLDEGKKPCRAGGNQPCKVYKRMQEIFIFLLLIFKGDFLSWRTKPFPLYQHWNWLVAADNTETISAGCSSILSTSTNARKFTHTSNCRDEILFRGIMFHNFTTHSATESLFTETPASEVPTLRVHIYIIISPYKGMCPSTPICI